MKELMVVTHEEAESFFRNNLRDSMKDPLVLDYVVDIMMDFMKSRKEEFICTQRPYSVIADELLRSDDKALSYERFRAFGDTFLWLCGFMPEHIAKKRRSKLGLEWYVEKGKDSYNYAIYIAGANRMRKEEIGAISRVSNKFEACSRGILEMRARASDSGFVIEPSVLSEIARVFYGGENPQVYLLRAIGKQRPSLRVIGGKDHEHS